MGVVDNKPTQITLVDYLGNAITVVNNQVVVTNKSSAGVENYGASEQIPVIDTDLEILNSQAVVTYSTLHFDDASDGKWTKVRGFGNAMYVNPHIAGVNQYGAESIMKMDGSGNSLKVTLMDLAGSQMDLTDPFSIMSSSNRVLQVGSLLHAENPSASGSFVLQADAAKNLKVNLNLQNGVDIDGGALSSLNNALSGVNGLFTKAQMLASNSAGQYTDLKVEGNNRLEVQSEYTIRVQRGDFPNQVAINKFGRNEDVDSANVEDIWDGGGTHVHPTQDRIHDIVSDNSNDSAAGTGARTIEISGISGGVLTQETVSTHATDGTIAVQTVNAYQMIHRKEVLTVGSNGSNVGTITATAQTDGTITAQINPGNSQTRMAIVKIEDAKEGFMKFFYGSLLRDSPTGATAILEVWQKKDVANAPWISKHQGTITTGQSAEHHPFGVEKAFAAGSWVKMTANVDANDCDVIAGFDMIGIDT